MRRLIQLIPVVIVVLMSIPVIGMSSIEMRKSLGLKSIPVPVVGTGSMYPSLFWSTSEGGPEDENKKVIEEYRSTPHLYRRFTGITIFGRTYLRRTVARGDMVAFKNAQTAAILQAENKDTNEGFIKRIIGIPGDVIEMRDGFVYLNGVLLSEPYITAPRSTYGGSTFTDCQKITIPHDKYFVLGDNRKVSSDSRFELGLIDDADIEYVLPLSEQFIYQSLWRDTSQDNDLIGQPSMATDEFLKLVNTARQSKGLPNLTLKSNLIKSASLRASKLIQNKNTPYSLKQAVSDANYTNILLGEFVSYGHYSAKELLQNLLYNNNTAKQVLNKDFTDVGLVALNREINGCPSQIIVGHFGGYIPANYDATTLNSWKNVRDNLQTIIPTWEKAVEYNGIDQGKLAELLGLLRKRLNLARDIVSTMENKAWLSDTQEQMMKQDEVDAKRAEVLAQELNKEQ